MKTPQPISRKTQIETQISVMRTQIWALELGHDFLSRDDKEQIAEWNAEIRALYKQLEMV